MITFGCLSPHPPIIIPAIGGDNLKTARATVAGMQAMATELAASSPDVLIFLTPHGNVFADCISCLGETRLKGDLGKFGHKNIKTEKRNDLELIKIIKHLSQVQGVEFIDIDASTAHRHHLNPDIDHGIMVPQYFLEEAGLTTVPIVAISIGFLPLLDLYRFGVIIAQAARELGRKAAIIASGDMSHRLKDDGPYRFHPSGPEFDHQIRDLIQKKDVMGLLSMPESLRDEAGECGYRSLIILLGALDGFEFASQVYSYEGPFGVGYLTAGFKPVREGSSCLHQLEESQTRMLQARRQQESLQVKWARMVLEGYVKTGHMPPLPPELEELEAQPAAAFVSLKKGGQLRGCIGTILPVHNSLAEEIRANAISAGTSDPRFPPVSEGELDQLEYSVDVLSPPEPATRDELDPKRYGVIVSRGHKRGVLLPDLEGVDTVEEQLEIALQKANISRDQGYTIERFKVVRYK